VSLLVLGLSHRSAPVELLDQAALTRDGVTKLLADVRDAEHVDEAAVVATCNRVEVYAEVQRFHGGLEELTELVGRHCRLEVPEVTPHLYVHYEGRAVQHLFSVAAGLDSMVAGETQILGQVRQALHDAQEAQTAGRALNELFQNALRVGKRVHTETGIDAAGRSLVTVGLALVGDHVGGIEGRRALVVGAGSMAALAAATLHRAGASVVVANRTYERGARVAASVDGAAIALSAVPDVLADVDVVVSCTGSAGTVLDASAVAAAMAVRSGAPIAVVDLALPHDVDPAVADLDGVLLVDLASIATLSAGTPLAGTAGDLEQAREIVADEVAAYAGMKRSSQAAPTVVALRAMADAIVSAELDRLQSRLPGLGHGERAELATTVRRVVDKLLHRPTVRVKQLAAEPGGQAYASALRELFALDPRAVDAVIEPEPPGPEPGLEPGAERGAVSGAEPGARS
jgi:glutamyl-tRNA reductase